MREGDQERNPPPPPVQEPAMFDRGVLAFSHEHGMI